MIYRARFAGGDYYEDDPDRLGHIYVEFDGAVVPAYPATPAMQMGIPSREWIETYRSAFWCLVSPFEYSADYPETYVLSWVGMAPLQEPSAGPITLPDGTESENVLGTQVLEEFTGSYPHVRFVHLTEHWAITTDQSPDPANHTFRVLHQDGTSLLLDRSDSTDEEEGTRTLSYVDAVNGSAFVVDRDRVRILHGPHVHELLMQEEEILLKDGVRGSVFHITEQGIRLLEGQSGKHFRIAETGKSDLRVTEARIETDEESPLTGVVTMASLDPFTGHPHIDASRSVFATGGSGRGVSGAGSGEGEDYEYDPDRETPPGITPEAEIPPPPDPPERPVATYNLLTGTSSTNPVQWNYYADRLEQWQVDYRTWETTYGDDYSYWNLGYAPPDVLNEDPDRYRTRFT